MLANRHSWTSPGRILIVGFDWPLTVRLVGALIPTSSVLIASPWTLEVLESDDVLGDAAQGPAAAAVSARRR